MSDRTDLNARSRAVAQMRKKAIERHPDPQDRKRLWLDEYRYNLLVLEAPGIPGSAFIANPGLAEYLLECFEKWEPTT